MTRRGAAASDETIEVPEGMRGYRVIYDDLFTEGMSARAWGLYCYLAMRPPGWTAHPAHLATVLAEGRDTLNTALKELLTLGLMRRVKYRDTQGMPRTKVVLDFDRYNGKTAGQPPNTEIPASGDPEPPEPPEPTQTDRDVPVGEDRPEYWNPRLGGSGPLVITELELSTEVDQNPNPRSADDALIPPPAPVKAVPDGTGQQAGGPKPARPEDVVAKTVYDTLDGGVTYIKVRQIAKHFLGRGRRPEDVTEAMLAVRNARRPITVETIHDALRDVTGTAQDSGLDYDVQQWRHR